MPLQLAQSTSASSTCDNPGNDLAADFITKIDNDHDIAGSVNDVFDNSTLTPQITPYGREGYRMDIEISDHDVKIQIQKDGRRPSPTYASLIVKLSVKNLYIDFDIPENLPLWIKPGFTNPKEKMRTLIQATNDIFRRIITARNSLLTSIRANGINLRVPALVTQALFNDDINTIKLQNIIFQNNWTTFVTKVETDYNAVRNALGTFRNAVYTNRFPTLNGMIQQGLKESIGQHKTYVLSCT